MTNLIYSFLIGHMFILFHLCYLSVIITFLHSFQQLDSQIPFYLFIIRIFYNIIHAPLIIYYIIKFFFWPFFIICYYFCAKSSCYALSNHDKYHFSSSANHFAELLLIMFKNSTLGVRFKIYLYLLFAIDLIQ